MNSLEKHILALKLNEVSTMNDLQNAGVVSDNCVWARDVSDGDSEKAVKWLKLQGGWLDRFLVPFIYCALARLVAARCRLPAGGGEAGDIVAIAFPSHDFGLRSAVATHKDWLHVNLNHELPRVAFPDDLYLRVKFSPKPHVN